MFAYLKAIQDVGVFVSDLVCQSYGGPRQRACTEKSKLNII